MIILVILILMVILLGRRRRIIIIMIHFLIILMIIMKYMISARRGYSVFGHPSAFLTGCHDKRCELSIPSLIVSIWVLKGIRFDISIVLLFMSVSQGESSVESFWIIYLFSG